MSNKNKDGLYELYSHLIALWNNSQVKYLKENFQSQEPEIFPLFMEGMYKSLKACFHMKTIKAFPKKNLTELIYDPNVFVFDLRQNLKSPKEDPSKILKRHQGIVENHARWLFLAKHYMKKAEGSKYGARIVDFTLHPERVEGWATLVNGILNCDLNKKKAEETNALLAGEQNSIANEGIAKFLTKRKARALPLGEYLPPDLSESIREPLRQMLNQYGDREKAEVLRAAVASEDGVGCLEREVFSRLKDFIKAQKRQKRGGESKKESLQKDFSLKSSKEEDGFGTVPLPLRDNSYRVSESSFDKKDRRNIENAAELDGGNLTKVEIANRLGKDRKTLRAIITKLYDECDSNITKDAFEK